MSERNKAPSPNKPVWVFVGGAIIGTLGGLIGLGGAEFRLPLLIAVFHFAALQAVILNKAVSLIVVASALIFRMKSVPLEDVGANWPTIINLLAGSLLGAWFGASWATRLKSATLYRTIAALLLLIAGVLVFGHHVASDRPLLTGGALLFTGSVAGFGIGIVASLLGVAGGELLIPTLVLLYGHDIKLAGSLSLAVSLPTMLVGFARYTQDQSFIVLRRNKGFLAVMAVGSIAGAFIGGLLLGTIPSALLLPTLAVILVFSAVKIWQHSQRALSSLEGM